MTYAMTYAIEQARAIHAYFAWTLTIGKTGIGYPDSRCTLLVRHFESNIFFS